MAKYIPVITPDQPTVVLPTVQPILAERAPVAAAPLSAPAIFNTPTTPADFVTQNDMSQTIPEQVVRPSAWQAFTANIGGMGRDLIGGYEERQFEPTLGYTPDEDVAAFAKLHGIANKTVLQRLHAVRSPAEFAAVTARLEQKEFAGRGIQEHPFWGIVGSIVDVDVPFAFVPYLGQGYKGAQVAGRTAQAAAAVGIAAGAHAYNAPQSIRTRDEKIADLVVFAAVGAFGRTRVGTPTTPDAAPIVNDLVSTATQALPVERTVVGTTTTTPTKVYSGLTAPLGYQHIDPALHRAYLHDRQAGDALVNMYRPANGIWDEASHRAYTKAADALPYTIPDIPRTAPKATDIFSGALPAVHGSKVANITLKDSAAIEDKSYFDNVFGDDVFYTGETRYWTGTVDEADAMRMPFYPNVHTAVNTFKKAFVLTPESLTRLPKGASGSGGEVVQGLKAEGYDGLIIRGFTVTEGDLVLGDLYALQGGVYDSVLQDQVIAFNAKNVKLTPSTRETLDKEFADLKQQYAPLVVAPAEIDAAVAAVAKETSDFADEVGVVGTVDIMGHPTKIPISQPLPKRTDPVKFVSSLIPQKIKGRLPDYSAQVAAIQSSADEMFHLTKGDIEHPANRLLVAPRTQGDNIPTATAAIQAELEVKLHGVEQTLILAAKEVQQGFGLTARRRAAYAVSAEWGSMAQKIDQAVMAAFRAGSPLDDAAIKALVDNYPAPEYIKAIQRQYMDSGFAELALSRSNSAGLLDHIDDVAKIYPRSTYMPVRHSYTRMHAMIKEGKATRAQIEEFLGEQIIRMYPEMQDKAIRMGTRGLGLSARDLGKGFFQTQKDAKLGLAQVHTAGLTRDHIEAILRSAAVPDEDIARVADKVYQGTRKEGVGAARPLRARMGWDFNLTFKGADGNLYDMGDLVDANTYMNLTDYARTMSHRIGAAQYGIKSTGDFQKIADDLMDNLPEGIAIEQAKEFLAAVQARTFGLPYGDAVPAPIRAGQTLAGALVLGASGIYAGTVDLTTQVAKMGLLRTLPETLKGVRNVVNPMKKMAANDAKDLEAIITGMLSTDTRWREFTMRYADDFAIDGDMYHNIQYVGQSAKFLNGAAYVKRFQIGLAGGVIATAFKNAAKGSARDIAYMKDTLKISDELTDLIIREHKAHGTHIDMWDNDVRIAMQQKVFAEVDNLAYSIRAGEVPAFMENSQVGKVIFPFMTSMFAMQQKVLRNTYVRDGAAGVALIAAVQFPAAILAGMVKNVSNGKDPEDNIASASVNSASLLGIFGFPMGIILSGGLQSSTAPLAPVESAITLGQKIWKGDADLSDVVKGTPFLGTTLPLKLLVNQGVNEYITAMED